MVRSLLAPSSSFRTTAGPCRGISRLAALADISDGPEGFVAPCGRVRTGGEPGIWEIASIAEALHIVAERLGKLRLVVMGRHSDTAEKALRNLMDKSPIEVSALGLLPGEEIVRHLASCDVLLFVRGGISSRRGSAIAGIACGLPVVALDGPETASPITEAGVVFADAKRQSGLGEALLKVLSDAEYREALAARSRNAQEKYFSWKAIAARYAEALGAADGKVTAISVSQAEA